MDETTELFDVVSISAGMRGLHSDSAGGLTARDQGDDCGAGAAEEMRALIQPPTLMSQRT